LPLVPKREKYALFATATAVGLLIVFVGIMVLATNARLADYIFVISLMVALLPVGVLDYLEFRWRRAVEARMPDILYDIAEGQVTGMTFLRALESAAMRDYGAASRELRRILTQIKLGMTPEGAFMSFARRVGSRLVKNASLIIVETSRSGGDVSKVVRTLSNYMRLVLTMDAERRGAMRLYIAVTYVAYGVLMVTLTILLNQFFLPVIELSGTMIFTAQAGYETYRRLFFYLSVIQGVFSGLVAGKMGEGAVSAGLKHIVVMLFLALLVFTIFVA